MGHRENDTAFYRHTTAHIANPRSPRCHGDTAFVRKLQRGGYLRRFCGQYDCFR